MLVLFESGADTFAYYGGFWGLDDDNRGEQVWEYEFKNSSDVDYNPALIEFWQEVGWENLPRQTGSDGRNNYDPAVYEDQATLGNAGAALTVVGTGATVVVGVACLSNPVGWITCMGGAAGLTAASATGAGFIVTLGSPPSSVDYPLLLMPTFIGNPPILNGLGSPDGLYQ